MAQVTDGPAIWLPLQQLADEVRQGKTTALELVERSLAAVDNLNPTYNAVIATIRERALDRARKIDKQVANSEQVGPLAGVPFVAKDNMLTFGSETTAASNMLRGFKAPYQSSAVQRLEDAGAICVAKANLDAFAHGGSTENSDYGVTKNPHDTSKVPGGSSGGSATAVAIGLAPFALGSDTGGSIRQPASYCGVVGFKPTYGLVSRSGVIAMASSTDVVGPLTTSVTDAAIVLDILAGKDMLDGTMIERDERPYSQLNTDMKGKKVGIVKEYFGDGLDPKVQANVLSAIDHLQAAGADVSEVSLPTLPLALAIYYVVVPAELSSNLSRHDGQRYQFAASRDDTLDESYLQSRTRGFGAEAKRRIMIGTHVLSSGYYDAYYNKAQTVRTKLVQEFDAAFKDYDYLVGPVAPSTAFSIGKLDSDPLQMYLQDIYSVGASLVGIPAISVPVESADGMPVGLQIMAAQKADLSLLSAARAYELQVAS